MPFENKEAAAAGQPVVDNVDPVDPVESCFLEASEDLWRMEADLSRAVVVTIVGTRPPVDLATAAEALHAEFGIGPNDMSIRPFHPEDFLVICEQRIIWQLMVERGRAPGHGFSLALRPWMRQAQATGTSLPFLVPLRLVGVPAHAWTRRTAEVILRGLGFVVQVADRTARRFDMSGFHVWLKTADPGKIPRRRMLFIPEPAMSRGSGLARADGTPEALWYPIEIIMLAPPVRDGFDEDGVPPPPPPPPPSPPSDDNSHDHGGGRDADQTRRSSAPGAASGGAEGSESQGSTAAQAPRDSPAARVEIQTDGGTQPEGVDRPVQRAPDALSSYYAHVMGDDQSGNAPIAANHVPLLQAPV